MKQFIKDQLESVLEYFVEMLIAIVFHKLGLDASQDVTSVLATLVTKGIVHFLSKLAANQKMKKALCVLIISSWIWIKSKI